MIAKGKIKSGDIVWTEFDPSIGHEYQRKRPAIVVQSNQQLTKSNLVTIIPLTSKMENNINDDILVRADSQNNLMADSLAKVYCLTSFDYCRFEKIIGQIDKATTSKIKEYLKIHFDF